MSVFIKYCSDINRLEQKAKDIAKWCMKNHFPWGSKKETQTDTEQENPETQKAQKQAERLTGEMPETIRGMAQAIAKAAKVSVETLYENKQLWHPEFTESRNWIEVQK